MASAPPSSSTPPCSACFPSPNHHHLLLLNHRLLASASSSSSTTAAAASCICCHPAAYAHSPFLSGADDLTTSPPLICSASSFASDSSSTFCFSSRLPISGAYTSSYSALFSASVSPFLYASSRPVPPSPVTPVAAVSLRLLHSSDYSDDPRSSSSAATATTTSSSPSDSRPALLLETSPPPSHRHRCDVYIGIHGGGHLLSRFARWLQAELELHQGVACFMAHRARFADLGCHSRAAVAIESCAFGVVIITQETFADPYGMQELQAFLERRNLVPVFFGLAPRDCLARDIMEKKGAAWEVEGGELWRRYGGGEDWTAVLDGLRHWVEEEEEQGWDVLRADSGNWRDCILRVASLVRERMGMRRTGSSGTSVDSAAADELPYPRNAYFVGRDKELKWLELILQQADEIKEDQRCTSVEDSGIAGRSRRRQLWRSCNSAAQGGGGIAIVSGAPGIGKTEIVLEYAHRFRQRYRRVVWVSGDVRYLRQNYLLNLSAALGIEAAEEMTALRRIKRLLQRDVPYLLVIDNLESESDIWDGSHVSEFIPAAGGAAHVIITTRISCGRRILQRMAPELELSYLSSVEALSLMTRCRKEELWLQDVNALKEMDAKLGRTTVGLGVVGALLSEMSIGPSELLQKMDRRISSYVDDNEAAAVSARFGPSVARLMEICLSYVEDLGGAGGLAWRMALVGAWFAPFPIPLSLLAGAAADYYYPAEKKGDGAMAAAPLRCRSSKKKIAAAAEVLLRCGIARKSSRKGWIGFEEAWRMYGRRRGGEGAAMAMVMGLKTRGAVSLHWHHFLAACFFLLDEEDNHETELRRLGDAEVLAFMQKVVPQLASLGGVASSSSLELLRLAEALLAEIEQRAAEEKGGGSWSRWFCAVTERS